MTNETAAPAAEAPAAQEATAAPVVDTNAAIERLQARLNGEQAPAQEVQEKEAAPAKDQPAEPKAEAAIEDKPQDAVEVPLTTRQRVALFRQEQALQKQRQELDTKAAAFTAKEKDFLERLLASPSAALKELGVENPADLATLLWNEALGDKAPAEYKQQAQARLLAGKAKDVEKEIQTLPEKIQQAVQQAVLQTKIEAKDTEIKSFVASVPAELKYLNRHAQKNPQETLQTFYDVAMGQFDKGNFNFTAMDIARELNAEMQAEYSQYQDLQSDPSTRESTPAVDQRQTTKTLMASETVEKPSKEMNNLSLDSPDWTVNGVKILNALLAKKRQ